MQWKPRWYERQFLYLKIIGAGMFYTFCLEAYLTSGFLIPWLVHLLSPNTPSSRGPVSPPTTSSFRILHQNVWASQTHPCVARKTWLMKTFCTCVVFTACINNYKILTVKPRRRKELPIFCTLITFILLAKYLYSYKHQCASYYKI